MKCFSHGLCWSFLFRNWVLNYSLPFDFDATCSLFVSSPTMPYSPSQSSPSSLLLLLAWCCRLGVVGPHGGVLAGCARGRLATDIARQMGPRPVGCGVTARQCCASHDICCGRFGPHEDQSLSKSAIQKVPGLRLRLAILRFRKLNPDFPYLD